VVNALANLDISLYRQLIRLQRSLAAARMARFLSRSGDGYLYVVLGLVFLLVDDSRGPLAARAMLLAFLIELPCFMALKAIIRRDRPFVSVADSTRVITPADTFSMPSGHTAAAFLMATLIAFFFSAILLPIYLWALLIGLSRVILGVHYPSDILAGAALGTSCAVLSLVLLT